MGILERTMTCNMMIIALFASVAGAAARHQVKGTDQVDRTRDLARDIMDGKVAVALDRNMKSQILVQIKGSPEFSDPCGPIGGCGALRCPAGFVETEEPGHCCPYCVNPNIKIDDIVTGPRGVAGGKPS